MWKTSVMQKVTLAGAAYKYSVSTFLTLAAVSFVAYGIATGQAALGAHPAVHYVILVVVLTLLGYLEGNEVSVLKLDGTDSSTWKSTHPRAYDLHMLASRGVNVQRFLIGRQSYVVFVVFLCSQVTTFPFMQRFEEVPESLWFIFVLTGLPGALIVLAFGQLMPQLIAAKHPVIFCNMLGAPTMFRMCLGLEWLGFAHFAWILTGLASKATGLDRGSGCHNMGVGGADLESVTPGGGWCGEAAHAALDGLMHIQTRWKNMASVEETRQFCASLRAEDSQTAGTAEQASASAPSFFVEPAMARAGMQTLSGIDDPAVLEYKKDTPQPHIYPTCKVIVAHLAEAGQDVPCFLLPPEHAQHVPPHIVAFGLMAELVGHTEAAAVPASI